MKLLLNRSFVNPLKKIDEIRLNRLEIRSLNRPPTSKKNEFATIEKALLAI